MENNLTQLTKACRDIINISKKYSYLWDNEENFKKEKSDYPDKNIYLAAGFIAQDESFNIYLTRKNKKFVYEGRNFCYEETGLNASEAAKRIATRFRDYNITESKLRKNYYEGLSKIFARHITRNELKEIGLEKEVLGNDAS